MTGDPALLDFIRATIRKNGPVTFAWFMEQALYHPEHGYYSSGRCEIGRRGDYFTNVSVGPLFGRLLAGQFAEMWESLGRPRDFAIVEQGAHHGDFARDVLLALRDTAADFFAALRYRIVEPFPILRQRQERTLADFKERMTWKNSLADLDPFCGVHFSNELLDALPVHLLRAVGGEWQERYVDEAGDGFTFVSGPIGNAKLRQHLETLPAPSIPNYETEVNLAALEWIEAVSEKLIGGYVVAIDYGYSRDDFYASHRSQGTLQGYARHQTLSSPLAEPGHADITAHVEWTSIAACAERCGFSIAGFTDQHHFMTGLISAMRTEEFVDSSTRRALQMLLHPELLGITFQFLALARTASTPPTLRGFKFARDARSALGL